MLEVIMSLLRIVVRTLALGCLLLPGCQKNEQSAVQPEGIAEKSSTPRAEPEGSVVHDDKQAAGGPLVPWASGKPKPVGATSSKPAASASASAVASSAVPAPTVTSEV